MFVLYKSILVYLNDAGGNVRFVFLEYSSSGFKVYTHTRNHWKLSKVVFICLSSILLYFSPSLSPLLFLSSFYIYTIPLHTRLYHFLSIHLKSLYTFSTLCFKKKKVFSIIRYTGKRNHKSRIFEKSKFPRFEENCSFVIVFV